MSYNVLSETLAERHPFLYRNTAERDLDWRTRENRIVADITRMRPTVVCLQEVEPRAFAAFQRKLPFYRALYKRRTGTAVDGCALLFDPNKFILVHTENIDFNAVTGKDNICMFAVLDRVIADSTSKSNEKVPPTHRHPSQRVCIATTHLLFNTNRGLLKLAQLHLILTHAKRIASRFGPYCNTILTGDWNMTEESAMYHYILAGETEPFIFDERYISGQNRLPRQSQHDKSTPYTILAHRKRLRIQHESHRAQSLAQHPTHPPAQLSNMYAPILFAGAPVTPVHALLGAERADASSSGLLRHAFRFADAVLGVDADTCPGVLGKVFSTWHTAAQALVDFIFFSGPPEEEEAEVKQDACHDQIDGSPPGEVKPPLRGRREETDDLTQQPRLAVLETLVLPERMDDHTHLQQMPQRGVPSDHLPLLVRFGFFTTQ
ncbi:Endonuclease/exonuclease/phosphatase [Chytriomyces sp. MP71]|nr:Endonuclease/exonuclease/phosphatase [Chytriomyces sp. MP71]